MLEHAPGTPQVRHGRSEPLPQLAAPAASSRAAHSCTMSCGAPRRGFEDSRRSGKQSMVRARDSNTTRGQHVDHGTTSGGVGSKLRVGRSMHIGARRRAWSPRIEEHLTARRLGTNARGGRRMFYPSFSSSDWSLKMPARLLHSASDAECSN